MKYKFFYIIIFIFFHINISAQDALIIKQDYILKGSDTLNRIDSDALKQGRWIDYERTEQIYISMGNIDTVNKIIYDEPQWILSKIIYPEHYIVKFEGYYINSMKEGAWFAFHRNGKKWKEVYFKNGNVKKDFFINYKTGNAQIVGEQISDTLFLVKFFNKQGGLMREKYYNQEDVNSIFPR